MAETNKSQMMSEAEIIEAINADSLISVSLGAGQPQKNVKMSTLASVAAGLMGINETWIRHNGTISNIGSVSSPGTYLFESSISPIEGYAHGVVLVIGNTILSNTWGWFVEFFFASDGSVFVRTAIRTSGSWGTWKKL